MAPPDPSPASSAAAKKKSNKKKKNAAKNKPNGDPAKSLESAKDVVQEDEEATAEAEAEDSDPSTVNTPTDAQFSHDASADTNGHNDSKASNGHAAETAAQATSPSQSTPQPEPPKDDSTENNASDSTDASARLEAMSQDREALRAEVEQLRKSLEEIQEKHTEEVSNIRTELEESQAEKEQAQSQYQNLLGRVNTIKSTLGERLQADREELDEARRQIEALEEQNKSLESNTQNLESEISRLNSEAEETSRELSSLRNRHNLSQQNWLTERDDLMRQLKHLREEAAAAKEAMGDWEVLAMEERNIREGLAERAADFEEQLSNLREQYERAASERDSNSQAVDGLQRALQEIQEARKRELREVVESGQEQLGSLTKAVQQAETRASEAEAAKKSLEEELERLAPFEKEVKEKNLLIGKLRHEAIVLNDHLTKALRFLKKAKPEDNVDRQIVTNHFLHFITLDRSDPKKFQVLQLIAALLNWTDEQREQAGLSRPGASSASGSLRLPISPFHRTPSTPSLSTEFFPEGSNSAGRESLGELWTNFLERQAEEGMKSPTESRTGSVSSGPGRQNSRA